MTRCGIAVLVVSALLATARAQEPPVPFRDPNHGRWGYKQSDGRVVIPPRFVGAGVFRDGRAPVLDATGFGIIDHTGGIVERIATDAVTAAGAPVAPPADACAWPASTPVPKADAAWPSQVPFPSTGLQCYVNHLRESGPVTGGEIAITPPGGEGTRSAIILKFANGVVLVERIGYEGFARKLLLPGVTADQASAWQLKLFPARSAGDGCSEEWKTGEIPGGAFIEQGAGC